MTICLTASLWMHPTKISKIANKSNYNCDYHHFLCYSLSDSPKISSSSLTPVLKADTVQSLEVLDVPGDECAGVSNG